VAGRRGDTTHRIAGRRGRRSLGAGGPDVSRENRRPCTRRMRDHPKGKSIPSCQDLEPSRPKKKKKKTIEPTQGKKVREPGPAGDDLPATDWSIERKIQAKKKERERKKGGRRLLKQKGKINSGIQGPVSEKAEGEEGKKTRAL